MPGFGHDFRTAGRRPDRTEKKKAKLEIEKAVSFARRAASPSAGIMVLERISWKYRKFLQENDGGRYVEEVAELIEKLHSRAQNDRQAPTAASVYESDVMPQKGSYGSNSSFSNCSRCSGRGYLVERLSGLPNQRPNTFRRICPDCGGLGRRPGP